VKDKLTRALRSIKAYYFFPVASPIYGKRGVPDVVACIAGSFVSFECKAGRNRVTEVQVANLLAIHDAGGAALVCNEANVEELCAVLQAPDAVAQLLLLSFMHRSKGYEP
jgi:Holliday junction resolvase